MKTTMRKEVVSSLESRLTWWVTGLIDTVFLVAWAALQYSFNFIVEKIHLTGVNQFVALTFQFLFAITTLAPPVFWIYKDIRIMLIRTQIEIQQAQRKGRKQAQRIKRES